MGGIIPFLTLGLMKENLCRPPYRIPTKESERIQKGVMYEPEKRVQKKVTRTESKLKRRARKAMTRKSRRTNRR